MKYMVMECHPGYAVVLGEDGQFQKVANLNYQVGQLVDTVVAAQQPKTSTVRKWVITSVSVAACLSVMIIAAWQMLWMPYGSIRIQINPEVQLTVNRMDDVVALEAINADGAVLIEGYDYKWKDMKVVSDELADRAVEMGYLADGGTIHVKVDSKHNAWKTNAQTVITEELEIHLGGGIVIELDDLDDLVEDLIEGDDDLEDFDDIDDDKDDLDDLDDIDDDDDDFDDLDDVDDDDDDYDDDDDDEDDEEDDDDDDNDFDDDDDDDDD